jgi:ketosteroid isomerase-like protein
VTDVVMAERIRAAYEQADLDGFGELLADDVRWGDDSHPNRCRGRHDVLNTFSGWVGSGVSATVTDLDTGAEGVACRLRVEWVDPGDNVRGVNFWHVLVVRDGRITEIRRYNDARSARKAIKTR